MSAETDLDNFLTQANANITHLAGEAKGLVTQAVTGLAKPLRFPEPPRPIEAREWDPGDTKFTPGKASPVGFPTWPDTELAPLPALQEVDTVDGEIDAVLDSLNLPRFIYPTIADAPQTVTNEPSITASFTLPPLPDTSTPPRGALLGMLPIPVPSMGAIAPQLAPITTTADLDPALFDAAFSQFRTDVFGGAGGLPGLDALLADLRTWSDGALQTLLPLVLTEVADRLGDRYAPVLASHTQLQQRLTQRLDDECDRVLAAAVDASGWDLPNAVVQALRATAEQVAQSWKAQALSQSDTQSAELALTVFEFCGDLFEQLQRGVQRLKTLELEQVLEAHRLSTAYAKQVTGALLAAFEADQFTRQDIAFQAAVAHVGVAEAELKQAVLRYEIANAAIEAAKGQQAMDAGRLRLYQADLQQAEQDTQIYAAQVGAARSELGLKTLPIEIFEARVRAFEARIEAHQARIAARTARIEGDSAKVDGQLKLVQAYEAKARGYAAKVSAQQVKVSAVAERNDAVIAEYRLGAKAALFESEQSLLEIQFDLAKYEVQANALLAEADLVLKQAKAKLEYSNREQDGMLQAISITDTLRRDLHSTELQRLKAVAQVSMSGAKIFGAMAEGAASAVSGIASAVLTESA